MIPGGEFTNIPQVSTYNPPLNEPYSPLYQKVWGGVALNDGSLGRMVQYWEVSYDGTNININPEGGSVEFSVAQANVETVSLGFDANMNPILGWQRAGTSSIYYYNGITSSYDTLTISGTTSCRVFLDDPRDFNTADSDVMIAYTKSNTLYYRQQRDNYTIEYTIGPTLKLLIKAGLNNLNRLQFELIEPSALN
jgi:hypothetical protein